MCAVIAQLGERQTEDLKVPGSIPGRGRFIDGPEICQDLFPPRRALLASISLIIGGVCSGPGCEGSW